MPKSIMDIYEHLTKSGLRSVVTQWSVRKSEELYAMVERTL